jgi:hypothetical protein
MRKEDFVAAYARFLSEGSAGLFIGAGISIGAGYPSWRQLVKEMAEDIGLDIALETDLPGIVQWYLNKAGRMRTRLAHIITQHFAEERPIPEVLRTLARLPIRHIWTTNYDSLVERAWREQRKKVDAKAIDKDVAHENPWAHTVLYKMHGTVEHPSDVVIAKADYEEYRRKRSGFLHVLTGHLASRHLLFLGLSFTDPNLNHLFTIIRESFEDAPPEHFAVIRKPAPEDYRSDEHLEYAVRRHDHWVTDLQYYGIQCIEVESYDDISRLMNTVERRLSLGSVLVSGSFPDTHAPTNSAERNMIEAVAYGLGELLAKRHLRLVSGFGLVVGSAVLSGVLTELNRQETPNLERSLLLRPFPQKIPTGWKRQEYYNRYRADLVMHAGSCVFISGRKENAGNSGASDGVLQEFEIAIGAGRTPIPIGATGGAASEIWARVNAEYARFYGKMPRKQFDELNKGNATPSELVGAVGEILSWLKTNDPLADAS